MEDIKLGNIPVMGPGDCIELLNTMYSNVINKGVGVKALPSSTTYK